jgi:hypothetical protein
MAKDQGPIKTTSAVFLKKVEDLAGYGGDVDQQH